jgi:hypothetical protein
MTGLELRRGAAGMTDSSGFGAVITTMIPAPTQNNKTVPFNENRGWYNRLLIDAVRTGSVITVYACYRSPFDWQGIEDHGKVVTVEMGSNGKMGYLIEDGLRNDLVKIKPTISGELAFRFPYVNMSLTNGSGGLASFYFNGLVVPRNTPNEAKETALGVFEFKTVSASERTFAVVKNFIRQRETIVRDISNRSISKC